MKISQILKENQPEVYKRLNKNRKRKKKRKRRKEHLSFSDFENMMKHDSYKRVHGALKQR